MKLCRLFFLYLLLCLPSTGLAHSLSDSYLELNFSESEVDGHWRIAIADLELAVGLDENNDGRISWGEIRQNRDNINRHVLQRLTLQRGDTACDFSSGDHQIANMNAGTFLHIPLSAHCATDGPLQISYDFLFGIDASHRGMMTLSDDDTAALLVFSPDRTTQTVSMDSQNTFALWWTFLVEGVWHIWIGADHILFLFALIIPIVLHRRQASSSPKTNVFSNPPLIPMTIDIVKMVTAFTVAHSVTLILASLGWVELPSRLVESIIALSVAVSGLNLLYPIFRGRLWQVAFVFGLVHGFGFASVLSDLTLPTQHFVSSLLAFNVGVEVGQLAIVLLLVPLLLLYRHNVPARQHMALMASGVLTTGIGLMWLAERSLNF